MSSVSGDSSAKEVFSASPIEQVASEEGERQGVENRVNAVGIDRISVPNRAKDTASPPIKASLSTSGQMSALIREVEQAVDRRNLRQVAESIETATTKGPDNVYAFASLGGTANPVTKLDVPFSVAKEKIPQREPVSRSKLDVVVVKAYQGMVKSMPKEQIPELQAAVKEVRAQIKGDTTEMSTEEVDHFLESLEGQFSEHSREIKNAFNKEFTLVDLSNVPVRYSKDQVLNKLRLFAVHQQAKLEKAHKSKLGKLIPGRKKKIKHAEQSLEVRSQAITREIENVQQHADPFLSESFVDQLSRKIYKVPGLQTLERALSPEKFREGLTEYVFSADVIVHNPSHPEVVETLKSVVKQEFDVQSYAYKTGIENQREILGRVLLESVGLDKFVMLKTEQRMRSASLAGQKDPEGIASRWIEGEGFPKDIWQDWLTARQNYLIAEHKEGAMDQPSTDLLIAHRALRDAQKQVYEVGGLESIAAHILIDTVFAAGDSHMNQYKMGDNSEFFNYDWAQFLAPHPAFTKGDQTFLTLRMALLNHPITQESMEGGFLGKLRELVLSWDVDEITSQWEADGLVGSADFFAARAEQMNAIEGDFLVARRAGINRSGLQELCHKHHIRFDGNQSEGELKQVVQKGLQEKFRQVKGECLAKVHPQAVQQWKTRTQRMQNYLKVDEEPTLRGAWEAYNADLSVFLKVLERTEKNSGEGLLVRMASPEEQKAEQKELQRMRPPERRGRSASFSSSIQAKLQRAGGVARRRYSGSARGAKPMVPQYIGEFIDPQHRYGAEIFSFWKVWENTKGVTDSFNDWMTKLEVKEDVPGKDQLKADGLLTQEGSPKVMSTVTYLSEAELPKYELEYRADGKFHTQKEGDLKTQDAQIHPHIFVLGNDGKFYAGEYTKGKFNHSSFYSGGSVLSAGRMLFEEGKLVKVEGYSGHYQPDDAMNLKTLKGLYAVMGDQLSRVSFEAVGKGTKQNALQAMKDLEKQLLTKEKAQIRQRRPLESILIQARRKNSATKEEIQLMEKSLVRIRKDSVSHRVARTAYPNV